MTAAELSDKGLFPQSDKACQPLEIIQEAGEIIFVPSGWHHQVYNLVRTVNRTIKGFVILGGRTVAALCELFLYLFFEIIVLVPNPISPKQIRSI